MKRSVPDFISQILPNLYGTLDEEERWPLVLDLLCEEMQLASAAVQVLGEDSKEFREYWCGRDSRSVLDASRHDQLINNGANPRLSLRPARLSPYGGALLSDLDTFPQSVTEVADFRARLGMCGMGPAIWLVMPMTRGRHICCILHRRADDGGAMTREAEVLQALEPHLDRLIRLSDRNTGRNPPILEEVLDHVRIGVVLVDPLLGVSWQNSAAASILERSAHLFLRGERLCATRAVDQRNLEQLVRGSEVSRGGLLVVGRDNGRPVELRAVRTGDRTGACWNSGPGMTALFLVEPDEAIMPDEAEISALSGLSPAESRLVAALVSGSGLDHFASHRGISLGTARVQLKQALAKTATNKQSLLVGRMLRSVASQTRA